MMYIAIKLSIAKDKYQFNSVHQSMVEKIGKSEAAATGKIISTTTTKTLDLYNIC